MCDESAVFSSYRPLGYVSNDIPLLTRYIKKRKEHLIVTVTGRSFHTYGSNKLGILSVSKQHPQDITAISAGSNYVYTAAGNEIYRWKRGHELVSTLTGHENPVHILLPFGPQLISVDTQSFLKIWNTKTGEEELELTFNKDAFKVTAVQHPTTYLDKILVGSEQGQLHLWNIKTTKLVYTFKGWGKGVRCLEQAPAIDVMAIGLQDGSIYLHNLKYDETVIHFRQDWGSVTGITFRSDGPAMMLTGSTTGHIAVWNLEERKLCAQMRGVHSSSGVTGIRCLPSEPLMVTSSGDNTLKMWIFDMPDGGGRLLRFREGHSKPPAKIRFYGSNGSNLLSAGLDSSLRIFSTVTDILNKSLGHASFNRKVSKKHKVTEDPVRMPPIVDFTTNTTREMEWDNIGSIHRGLSVTTTWSWGKQKMGELKLKHERFRKTGGFKGAKATCIELTACGNFVIIGYSSGHIDRYNIQSGIYRGEYMHGDKPGHKNPVRGVASDSLNQCVVSADARGIVKFWRFKTQALLEKVVLGSDLSSFRLHRNSNLLACALQTFDIVILDIDTRETVRRFTGGHSAAITDISFSHDGRWLISASLDATARVWDLPTGHCIDYISFPSAVTSLDFSPAGDLLATTHVEDLGIYLWCNKAVYQHLYFSKVADDAEPRTLSLPSDISPDDSSEQLQIKMEVEAEDVFKSPDQINQDLVTLANLPTSRWLNLFNIDIIKARNKPKAPPKKPKAAPFFLPSIPGIDQQFFVEQNADGEDVKEATISQTLDLTQFGKALGQAVSDEDFKSMYNTFLEKGPSAIDIEIRALAPEGGGSIPLMQTFLTLLQKQLENKTNFETVHAHLGLFLQVHGETIVSSPELRKSLESLEDSVEKTWTQLQDDINTSLCLVNFCKSSFL